MKTATKNVESVSLWCPHCGEMHKGRIGPIESAGVAWGRVTVCWACKVKFRLPKSPWAYQELRHRQLTADEIARAESLHRAIWREA